MTEFTPRAAAWRARIEAAFAAQGMMRTLDASLDLAEPGRVRISAPNGPATAQHHGQAHAGLAFTLGDNAAGFAAQSLVAEDEGVVTVEMKINLLAPGIGPRLTAEGRVERAGRRLTVVRADVWGADAEGRPLHVATMLGTILAMQGRI